MPGSCSTFAVRLGFREAKGLAEKDAAALVKARDRPYRSIDDAWRRAAVPVTALERLAEADGFGSLGLGRRQALWAIGALKDQALPLFAAADVQAGGPEPEFIEPAVTLPVMTPSQEVVEDYTSVGLSLRQHPLAFLRADLAAERFQPLDELSRRKDGSRIRIAGLVLVRQRPGSAKGVMFITLEDETGHANLVIWPDIFERFRLPILISSLLAVDGRVQREGDIIHVVVESLADRSAWLKRLTEEGRAFEPETGRGDEVRHGGGADSRDRPPERANALDQRPRDIYIPDRLLKVPARNFR